MKDRVFLILFSLIFAQFFFLTTRNKSPNFSVKSTYDIVDEGNMSVAFVDLLDGYERVSLEKSSHARPPPVVGARPTARKIKQMENCKPKDKVYYLKIHKTASSVIENILTPFLRIIFRDLRALHFLISDEIVV